MAYEDLGLKRQASKVEPSLQVYMEEQCVDGRSLPWRMSAFFGIS